MGCTIFASYPMTAWLRRRAWADLFLSTSIPFPLPLQDATPLEHRVAIDVFISETVTAVSQGATTRFCTNLECLHVNCSSSSVVLMSCFAAAQLSSHAVRLFFDIQKNYMKLSHESLHEGNATKRMILRERIAFSAQGTRHLNQHPA